MLTVLRAGGLGTGGFNFDAKLRCALFWLCGGSYLLACFGCSTF
jgi:hypothetical protein